MYLCQWHIEVPYGKRGEAVRILKAWIADELKNSEFRRAKSSRVLAGAIGVSGARVIHECTFESLADYEAALADMAQPQFKKHSDALAPFIIPGSQHWQIFKILE